MSDVLVRNNEISSTTNTSYKSECGAGDAEAKLAKPTLVITGTDDNNYMPHGNALILAGKIPGARLVQIKDAGHAVMHQYPDEIGDVVTLLESPNDKFAIAIGNGSPCSIPN